MVGFRVDGRSFFPPAGVAGTGRAWPHADRVARLRRPEVRAALVGAPAPESGVPFILHANLHKLFPLGDPPDYEPAPEASVAAIAAREGRTAARRSPTT